MKNCNERSPSFARARSLKTGKCLVFKVGQSRSSFQMKRMKVPTVLIGKRAFALVVLVGLISGGLLAGEEVWVCWI